MFYLPLFCLIKCTFFSRYICQPKKLKQFMMVIRLGGFDIQSSSFLMQIR